MKRIVTLIGVCLFTLLLCVGAAASPAYMTDETGLLSQADVSELESELAEISARLSTDVVILFQSELPMGKTATEVADDFYDYGGYRENGILLYVAADGYWAISTSGDAIWTFSDSDQELLMDNVLPYLREDDFLGAFHAFAGSCESRILAEENGEEWEGYEPIPQPFHWGRSALIALLGGFFISLLVTGSMKSKLKTVRAAAGAGNYVEPGSLRMTDSRDLFLYMSVARQPKPQQQTGTHSGGSSTHTSSSGHIHGGSSGRF